MKFGLVASARKGDHYELALRAIQELKRAQFSIHPKSERELEIHLVDKYLTKSKKLSPYIMNLIETDHDKRPSKVDAFGFNHAPDIAIETPEIKGTAIEVKLIKSGADLRACVSQALVYRLGYRFAIMVLADRTEKRTLVGSLLEKNSKGAGLLRDLCDELNVFTVIGPVGPDKPNLTFVPKRTVKPPPPPPEADVFSSQAPSPTTIG